MNSSLFNVLNIAVSGSADFCRGVTANIVQEHQTGQIEALGICSGNFAEIWTLVVSHRPNCLVVEVGLQHNERQHQLLKRSLFQIRERFNKEIYIVGVLAAPEKLFFAGDLLFDGDLELKRSGCVDTFIAKPPASMPSIPSLWEQLRHALKMAGLEMTRRLEGKRPLPALGDPGWVQSLADPSSRELWMQWLPRYATYTNENPIIIGETGTGKTNLAYALHLLSERKGEFVSITPRDFSSSELVQAELFGAVPGAYTGAIDKWGLVKSAEHGTLFIDELQSIDKDLQGKIITFIENKAYRRVGSAESIDADVRFVFATNRSLQSMMESNVLRHDFAYRLERVQLQMARLSERRLDIPAALAYAIAKVRRQRPHSHSVQGVTSDAYRLLFSHSWPGNLRQLENSVAQMCEFSDIEKSDLIDHVSVSRSFESRLSGLAPTAADIIARAAQNISYRSSEERLSSLKEGLNSFSDEVRNNALEACAGDITRAAKLIGDDPKVLELYANAACARRVAKGVTQ